jgi:hypothetical protein
MVHTSSSGREATAASGATFNKPSTDVLRYMMALWFAKWALRTDFRGKGQKSPKRKKPPADSSACEAFIYVLRLYIVYSA